MEGRVLIIEDHQGNRELLKKQIEEVGIEVYEAENGEDGIQAAVRSMPQVVLISTSLPDMPGFKVVEKLRSIKRTQHEFLMMLGDEDNRQERLSGLDIGANDFIASPFDPDLVALRVRNAINRANQESTTDPTTGLPAGRLVQDQLRALLRDPEGKWCLFRFRILHVGPFRDGYGFLAGQELLRGAARIMAEALGDTDTQMDFLGYLGNDDFMVIIGQDRAEAFEAEVRRQFDNENGSHYSFFDREKGYIEVEGEEYPLASLRVLRVTPEDGPFYDIRSLSEAIAG